MSDAYVPEVETNPSAARSRITASFSDWPDEQWSVVVLGAAIRCQLIHVAEPRRSRMVRVATWEGPIVDVECLRSVLVAMGRDAGVYIVEGGA